MAYETIADLVNIFNMNVDIHKNSNEKNESETRKSYIDPMFELMGWNVSNEGLQVHAREVTAEYSVTDKTGKKKADYSFNLDGKPVFFVEAKDPYINIEENKQAAFQLRGYCWNAKIPVGVLTDFEEFAVYDGRYEPKATDSTNVARIKYFNYKEYGNKWDEITSLFSRESVSNGSLNTYINKVKIKKGVLPVDEVFLKDMESWRKLLAVNIASHNPELSRREINFAVQRTIDRIVFLRICEDRGTEPYGEIKGLKRKSDIYSGLMKLFRAADQKYNSGIFCFKKEKGRLEGVDTLSPKLKIGDEVLKSIVERLYYPSPYNFAVMTGDILGQIYERFLGKVIEVGSDRKVSVEEKPEVRKAGGVYYTPTYIVDYIVKNTIGKLVEGKTPTQVAKMRFLDPACGSGSFLIQAYQYVLDWHLTWYSSNDSEKHMKGKRPVLVKDRKGNVRLSIDTRKQILLNNIFGVDIDFQAVEVSKLSLLLKVLEGEDDLTMQQLSLFKQRALPDLGENIKCGNSLISADFYEGQQGNLFDEEEMYRINVFDWNTEFPEIMKDGGFNAVIGNPPWGAQIHETANRYLSTKYARVVDRMVDTYIYFIDKSVLISKLKSMIGLVIPATLLNQSDTKSVRQLLVMHGVSSLTNLGAGIFGKGATNTTLALIGCKDAPPKNIYLNDLRHCDLVERKHHLLDGSTCVPYARWKQLVSDDPHYTFFVTAIPSVELLSRLQRKFPPFSSILDEYGIQRGVTPDFAEMHLIADPDHSNIETNVLRKSLSGNRIHRFQEAKPNCGIIYTTKQTDIRLCPNALAHMTSFKSSLTCKEIKAGKHPWWRLHRPRKPEIFKSPKFIGVTTSRNIEVVYDDGNDLVVTDACYIFRTIPHYNHRYVLGILHSQLFDWLYKTSNQGDGRVIPQVKATKLRPLPIRSIDFNNSEDVTMHDQMVNLVVQMLDLNKKFSESKMPQTTEMLNRQIKATDKQIDQLVYELYGLNDDEIKIVNGET